MFFFNKYLNIKISSFLHPRYRAPPKRRYVFFFLKKKTLGENAFGIAGPELRNETRRRVKFRWRISLDGILHNLRVCEHVMIATVSIILGKEYLIYSTPPPFFCGLIPRLARFCIDAAAGIIRRPRRLSYSLCCSRCCCCWWCRRTSLIRSL